MNILKWVYLVLAIAAVRITQTKEDSECSAPTTIDDITTPEPTKAIKEKDR